MEPARSARVALLAVARPRGRASIEGGRDGGGDRAVAGPATAGGRFGVYGIGELRLDPGDGDAVRSVSAQMRH